MKKLLFFVLLFVGTFSFTFAFTKPEVGSNITVQTGNSFYTQDICVDGQTFYETYHYYIGDTFFMRDSHYGNPNGYAYVFDTASRIILVDPYNVFNFDSNFKYKSNGKPVGVNKVVFVQNSGYFKTGSLLISQPDINGGALVGQIVVNLYRKWFWNGQWGLGSYDITYFPYPDGPQQTTGFSHYYEGKYTDGYECFNYVVHYCGDGVIDTQTSIAALPNGKIGSVANEQCDDGAQNGQPGHCNISCNGYVPDVPTISCGDGIINQSFEDCDPGSGNFWNGCNDNCKLMTPSCSLTVNPSQGNVPLTVSISGTTNSWWGRIVYLNFGDGQTIGNGWDGIQGRNNTTHSFQLSHTYNTTGTFYLTGQVLNIYPGEIRTGAIRPVAYCNINVTTTQPAPTPYCGDGNLDVGEQCDPGSGNFRNGCNDECKLMTPECTLTVNPNRGNVPLDTTVDATKPSWAKFTSLLFGDGTPILSNPTFPRTHTYATVGTFSLVLGVKNNYNGQIATGVTIPVASCMVSVHTTSIPTPYCGDGILQTGEECDPGTGNFGNGCNDCHLMTPECTLTVNPNQGNIPLDTIINGTTQTWAVYTNLVFGDGQSQTNPDFPLSHTYTTLGTFNLVLWVKNNYSGEIAAGVTNPIANCTAIVNTIKPGSPVPYLLKQQKTGGMNNFTTHQINVELGEVIEYKINFGNSGTVAATGKVWDILPPCTTYLTSSIVLPNGVTYNGPVVGTYGSQDTVQYKDFLLQPGQGGYMLVQAQIRGTGMNGMTSCSNVTSYLNTGYFNLGGTTLQSDVVAVRPKPTQKPHLIINKELLSAGDMTAGSTVEYRITLTNDGNATYYNAYILDILPNAIQYQTSSIQNITNYFFEEGTTGNNEYFIKYYNFNLVAGQSAVVYLTGILKKGFNFDETVNCAMTSGAVDCEEFPLNPMPFLKKWQKTGGMTEFTDEIIQVELGETITYKVDFGNIGNRGATGQVWDVLPPCVKYVSSSIHLPNGISYSGPHTGQQGAQDFVMYKDFFLDAGQTGYMLVDAEIKGNGVLGLNCSNTRSYLNTGYFKFLGGKPLSSDVLAIREESIGSEVAFDKTGNKKLMHPGETGLEFIITVTNKGPDPISNIYVDDIRPDENQTCIVYEGRTGDESLIEYVSYLRWHYIGLQGAKTNYNLPGESDLNQVNATGILYAGQSFNFTIFAHVADDPSCVGYYVNKAKLTYTVGGKTGTLYDDYDFEVIDDNTDYACKSITSAGSIVELGTNNQGHMRFTCTASDSNPHTIYIDCGNGRGDTGYNTPSFTYNCTYGANDEGLSLAASCIVDGQEPTNPACMKNIKIGNVIPLNDCGDGTLDDGEECDLGSIGTILPIQNGIIDTHYTYSELYYGVGYSCKYCKVIKDGNFVYEPAECLSTDTPISVMNNEMLPYWWRLWIKDTQRVVDDDYCSKHYGDKTSTNDITILNENSMICHFSVYNGTYNQNVGPIMEFEEKCFNEYFDEYDIYEYFKESHQTQSDGAAINSSLGVTNAYSVSEFGEYKLVLEKVDYEYCDTNDGKWKPGERYGAVCEVNFAITRPYIVQVSTFGVNPVGTNGADFLNDYFDMFGEEILTKKTDLKNVIRTDNSDYAVDDNVQSKFDEFKKKYKSLAIKIDENSTIKNTNKSSTTLKKLFNVDEGAINSIKKVSNKSIYFIEGDGKLRLSQDTINNLTPAYTIIVEGMDVEIVGDVLQYAMIVTDQKMSFKDSGKEGNMRCANGGQVVQGIYVALGGFKAANENLLNKSKDELRCPWGGLHVKGVLIGDNINEISNNKRAQLNSWFNLNGNEPTRNRQRREKIIKGASLLIEYNPSLWKTLPPGAEIFTENLEIYRK